MDRGWGGGGGGGGGGQIEPAVFPKMYFIERE